MTGAIAPPAIPQDITHRRVLTIALPMMLAYLSTPIVGLVDTTVIGRLGSAALLGGIAVGAIIFDVLFTTFNFLRAGTTGLTAQALGAGDRTREAAILVRALAIAIAAGLTMILASDAIIWLGLTLLRPEGLVRDTVVEYTAIRLFCAPFALANYALLGWFIGLGRAGTALLLQLVLNGVNILLTVVLVIGHGFGVAGVAWGSVAGEAVATLVGLLVATSTLYRVELPSWERILRRDALLRMLSVNRDIMIRSLALLLVFAFFTAQSVQLGEATLAANAVLINFFLFGGYFLDGFATAAEQLAGQAVGAGQRKDFDQSVRLTRLWCLVLGAAASALFFVAGPFLIDFMTTSEAVREVARVFLIWAALTPLFGALAFQMDGVYIGATWTVDMRNMMLVSVVLAFLVWWIAMPLIGNHGLWLALAVFLFVRGLTLWMRLPVRAREIGPAEAVGS